MMKKSPALLCVPLFLGLMLCMLTHSELAVSYASAGLLVWFNRMVPTLLPFMILSGVLIRMRLAGSFASLFSPVLAPVFRVSGNCLYVMLMGFVCGFPMGAKCTADMLEQGQISRREARFLLAFCNNIGPVYFCGYVVPLLGIRRLGLCLFGMYGLPLLYGLVLRYTVYRVTEPVNGADIRTASASPISGDSVPGQSPPLPLLAALDASVASALQSMTMLGGYMVLFNLLNLVPALLAEIAVDLFSQSIVSAAFCGLQPDEITALLSPLLEISGGLQTLGASHPLYSLIALTFGGLSCLAQTYACIRDTGLSLSEYALHRVLLTAVTAVYYLIAALI